MRVVFYGTPEFAVPSMRSLLQKGHSILAVVTRPDKPRRRQFAPPEPSPVKSEGVRVGLPVFTPSSMREPGLSKRLVEIAPEVMVVVAFGQILPPEILTIPPMGCINVHASLLPKYRGAAPIARAIMAGESVTGVTTMQMDKGLDTGDILQQRECPIMPGETTAELTSRLAGLGAVLLVETLDRLSQGAVVPRKQNDAAASLAPALRRADGEIDWRRDALQIAAQVRGCNPWPLAASSLRDRRVAILRAEENLDLTTANPSLSPGEVIISADAIVVQCGGTSQLRILQVQLPGRKPMSAREAVNGRLIRVGEVFAPASSAT